MAVLDDLNMLVRNGKMTRNEARAAYPRRWYDSTAFPECVLTIKHFPERGEDLHKGLMEDCQTCGWLYR